MARPSPPTADYGLMSARVPYADGSSPLHAADLDQLSKFVLSQDGNGMVQQVTCIPFGTTCFITIDRTGYIWVTHNAYTVDGGISWYSVVPTLPTIGFRLSTAGFRFMFSDATSDPIHWAPSLLFSDTGFPKATAGALGLVSIDTDTLTVDGNGKIAVNVAGVIEAAGLAAQLAAMVANSAEAQLNSAISSLLSRPGDAPAFFTGGPGSTPSSTVATTLTPVSSTTGKALQLTGAGTLYQRGHTYARPNRVYRITARVKRITDPLDETGDAVLLRLSCMDQNNTPISPTSIVTAASISDLLVANDTQTMQVFAATASGSHVTYVLPAGTIYFRAGVQTRGVDGVTNVEVIDVTDVTDYLGDPIVSELAQSAIDAAATIGTAVTDAEGWASDANTAATIVGGSALFGKNWADDLVTVPTGSEADGTRYIVKPTGSGAFAGKDNQVAEKVSGSWAFSGIAGAGQILYVISKGVRFEFGGSTWAVAKSQTQTGTVSNLSSQFGSGLTLPNGMAVDVIADAATADLGVRKLIYDSADSTTAADNIVTFVDAQSRRFKTPLFNAYVGNDGFNLGNTASANKTLLLAASAAAVARGTHVKIRKGTFPLTDQIDIGDHHFVGEGPGRTTFDFSAAGAATYTKAFMNFGMSSGPVQLAGSPTGVLLTADTSATDTILFNADISASLAKGDRIILHDTDWTDNPWSLFRVYYRQSEECKVVSVAFSTGVTTVVVDRTLSGNYLAASTLVWKKIGRRGKVEGFGVIGGGSSGINPGLINIPSILIDGLTESYCGGLHGENSDYAGIAVWRASASRIIEPNSHKWLADSNTSSYGMSLHGQDLDVEPGYLSAVRHALTVGSIDDTSFVINRRIRIVGGTLVHLASSGVTIAAADLHGNTEDCSYHGCEIRGGIQFGGHRNAYTKNKIRTGSAYGSGMVDHLIAMSELKSTEHLVANNEFVFNGAPPTTSGVGMLIGSTTGMTANTTMGGPLRIRENDIEYTMTGSAAVRFLAWIRNLGCTATDIDIDMRSNSWKCRSTTATGMRITIDNSSGADFREVDLTNQRGDWAANIQHATRVLLDNAKSRGTVTTNLANTIPAVAISNVSGVVSANGFQSYDSNYYGMTTSSSGANVDASNMLVSNPASGGASFSGTGELILNGIKLLGVNATLTVASFTKLWLGRDNVIEGGAPSLSATTIQHSGTLMGTATVNPGTVAAGASAGPFSVPATGAATSMQARCRFSQVNAGCVWEAVIAASGTISCWVTNKSGSPVTFSSGTLTAECDL